MTQYVIRLKGGPGSGNHGHKGIPGHQGGSLPKGESNATSDPKSKNTRSSNKGTQISMH